MKNSKTTKQRNTIVNVAKEAGVSIGTVSRILNGYATTEATLKKVNQAIANLNYTPNVFARGIRGARRNCIGILISTEISEKNQWMQNLVMSLIKEASAFHYKFMIEFVDVNANEAPRLIQEVDGCLVVGVYPEKFFKNIASESNIPLVTLSGEAKDYKNSINIEFDYASGTRKAVTYLLASGRHRIALLNGPIQYPTMKARQIAYLKCLEEFGITKDENLIASLNGTDNKKLYDESYKKTIALLKQNTSLDAIIYAADDIAISGIQAIKDYGLKVPEDICVTGFNNTGQGEYYSPTLSSISIDYKELARTFIEGIENLLNRNKRTLEKNIVLDMNFIKRDSVTRKK
jgi:DNA-binding LacI/PurR family transcriptional regulator